MAKISINMKAGTLAEESEVIVGIDLGTTNSLVAYMDDGTASIVKDALGAHALVPSVVHFNAKDEILVGDEAKQYLLTDPQRTIFSVKRLLGKSYEDLDAIKEYLGYRIIDQGEDQLVKIVVDGKYYSPIELSAEILKKLKSRIETQLNKKVTKAVITVPAYFNDSQRQATKDAGKLAGLDVLRIINEPTAASLAYGIGRSEEEQKNVAVYDLGGGTFDISILSIHDGIFEVLATNGDTFLGGDDFDRIIIQHWIVNHQLNDVLHAEDRSMMQGLRLLAEEAKITLGTEPVFSKPFGEHMLALTQEKMNELITPLIEQSIKACKQAMNDAQLAHSDIDKILMVGGSTRIPLVRTMISEFFGNEVDVSLDPDQVVALGAAIQADVIAGKNKDLLLLDITPLSLGIETVGGLMDTIIARNSKIPIKSGRSYTTSVDGQKNLKLGIYQGERDLVADNRKLGEFILKDIPPMAAGIPKITVHFIIDADGILKVRAMEERSNTQTEVVIKSQYGISEEAMAKMLIDSIQNAELDVAQRSLLEARNEGNNVVRATAKFITQNEWLSKSEIEQLVAMAKTLELKIASESKDEINQAMEILNVYSRPLAEKALDIKVAEALKTRQL